MPSVPGPRFTRAIVAATVLLAAVNAVAQDITLTPKLRAGDDFQVELVRIRENSSRPLQNGKGRTVIAVRVLSAAPDGFELEWIPGPTTIDNPQVAQDPALVAASAAVRDVRFRIRLNADGEMDGLLNEAEVAPKLQSMTDTLTRELSARLPPEQRKGFEDAISAVLSPAVLIAQATNDVGIYFGLSGIGLAADETVEVDIDQPSPLGGVIPTTFRVHMTSATADTAALETTTTYDRAALAQLSESLIKTFGATMSPEELAKLPPLEMADEGRFLFDRTVGLMREAIVRRRATVGPVRRFDAWELRLISGPRR